MKGLKLGVIILATVLLTAAILQNTGPVETRLLFFSFEAPKAVMFLVMFLVGFALGMIVASRLGPRFGRKQKPSE